MCLIRQRSSRNEAMPDIKVSAANQASLAGSRRRFAGVLWAALEVLIFPVWFVITRFSVTRELRIWDITALRFGIGAVPQAPLLVQRHAILTRCAWGKGLVFAVLWSAPFVLLVALGLSLTSAAQVASIAPTLMPLFAGIFAWAFLGERQGGQRWAGYAAILAGWSLLMLTGAAAHGPPSLSGLAALAAAAAMWAVYALLFRRSGLTSIEAAALICFWSAALFLPIYLLFGLSHFNQAPASEIALQAVYQHVMMSGIAIFTFNRAVGLFGSAAATAIIALIPAVASLLAIPILCEMPSSVAGIVIAIIVTGVLLASRQPGTVGQVLQKGRAL